MREGHHLLEQRIVKLMQQAHEHTTGAKSGELAVEDAVSLIYLCSLEGIRVAEDGTAYSFEQISDLGECKICYAPSFQTDQDCQSLHSQLIIYVATEQGQAAIEGIFLFADDEHKVDIQLLSVNNLLQQPPFVQKIDEVIQSGEIFPFGQLQDFVQKISAAGENQEPDLILRLTTNWRMLMLPGMKC